MDEQRTSPLEIEFLEDGHVRIGESVLGAEDSQKFSAQIVAGDYISVLDRAVILRQYWTVGPPFVDASGRVYRGPFIFVPVSVASLPTGIAGPKPDPLAQLIGQYIEPDSDPRRVEEARLRDHGYAVWALLGDLLLPGRTADLIAREYRVPVEAVDAVWAYYLRNRVALDRRLAENRAA